MSPTEGWLVAREPSTPAGRTAGRSWPQGSGSRTRRWCLRSQRVSILPGAEHEHTAAHKACRGYFHGCTCRLWSGFTPPFTVACGAGTLPRIEERRHQCTGERSNNLTAEKVPGFMNPIHSSWYEFTKPGPQFTKPRTPTCRAMRSEVVCKVDRLAG